MAVCNIVLEEYVVSHQYCLSAIELDPSIYKEKVATIKQKARDLRNYIENNNLLVPQDNRGFDYQREDNIQTIEHNPRNRVSAVKPELDYKTILNNLQNE